METKNIGEAFCPAVIRYRMINKIHCIGGIVVRYQSSRGGYWCKGAAQAIKLGISPDGGLFVPEKIPVLDSSHLISMCNMDYIERACLIIGRYLEDFSQNEIMHCVQEAYGYDKFDHPGIAPLHRLEKGVYIQELWHGPTCAFKDIALQILPHLLKTSLVKTGEQSRILILVATSGDTGKAALEGFRDVEGTSIIVFYPDEGVSEVQKRQMLTQDGGNVFVSAVKGNFDDAQTGVKEIFTDKALAAALERNGVKLSSANSINWGRLLPQIVYYVSAYADLLAGGEIAPGDAVNVVVPTGNFGNILAAYYARCMGVNINRLLCASNSNNILTDFINTGTYNRKRQFYKTISPSMDILISSNLERLLFEVTGRDAAKVAGWMEELARNGIYSIDQAAIMKIKEIFWADYSSEKETLETIAQVWNKYAYLVDTHTAVGINVYNKYLEAEGDDRPTIIASTASPYKFGGSVARAILGKNGLDEFEALLELERFTGVPIPPAIKGIAGKAIRFSGCTDRGKMRELVLELISEKKV